jgi:hypothetical protein
MSSEKKFDVHPRGELPWKIEVVSTEESIEEALGAVAEVIEFLREKDLELDAPFTVSREGFTIRVAPPSTRPAP